MPNAISNEYNKPHITNYNWISHELNQPTYISFAWFMSLSLNWFVTFSFGCLLIFLFAFENCDRVMAMMVVITGQCSMWKQSTQIKIKVITRLCYTEYASASMLTNSYTLHRAHTHTCICSSWELFKKNGTGDHTPYHWHSSPTSFQV